MVGRTNDNRRTCQQGCISDSEIVGYEQGYDTGALCEPKMGYDFCMELLNEVGL